VELVQIFTGSHWMPPMGKYLHYIALVAATVVEIQSKCKTVTKTNLLLLEFLPLS
jgi:hypothetical protein